ncbi:hypothetical protein [Hydrogenophaga pseudoflava]|uniref:hypothetical protein n=1 Tax=Hydrogenophaga pseudoflava TaxID=47421 RepID=UPI0027E4616A|nr:hypothetical protein [Hydrogenophaga pseudoflava]MDQ7744936.1 hypothetical protein [Hydrogenophaga pseudoflava]
MRSQPIGPVRGRSFPRTMQWLATAAMAGLLYCAWGAREALAGMSLASELRWLGALAVGVVVWNYLLILFSTTAIDGDHLSQGWLWRTSIPLRDIAQVKLLRWRPLDALVAPRLVVRTRSLGQLSFHAADPAVLQVLDVLVHGQGVPEEGGHNRRIRGAQNGE